MNNLLFVCLLSYVLNLISFPTNAQQGEWTWMKGDSTPNSIGTFGTMGTADPANKPPGLYEPCEWRDHDGNFWLLGGGYNTLWKFDVGLNEWTWMKGSSSAGGSSAVYGIQGVPAPANTPGSRAAATSWVDNDGELWLYGGVDLVSGLSDLWKYDISSNEWTWMDGSSIANALGIYGTKGIPAASNDPGSRLETAASWVDDSNYLWFFGGQLCCTANGYIDDVWRYNTATSEWTWMQGSSTSSHPPVYGTLGVADSANTPGGRRVYSHWKDEDGNFWIFGGQGNGGNVYNDLWKYDHNINVWTWMHGAPAINSAGHYGNSCEFDSLNEPPARMENRFYWIDSCNNFWMFGGLNTFTGDYRNDLWCYSPSANKWKWTSGSIAPDEDGLYGTMGTGSSSNHPGARYGGVAWMGGNESLWLFGGHGYPFNNNVGELNDLWRFVPDSTCVACNIVHLPAAAFESTDTALCEKFCIGFTDQSTNNPTSWQWIFPGGDPATSSDQNPSSICYDVPGVYDVTLITTNAYGSDTLTLSNFITVYSTPSFPTITQVGYTLTSSAASSYQWQFNSVDIPGATNQSYTILQSGYYTVIVGDSNSCKNSFTEYVLISGVDDAMSDAGISIYPNPSSGTFRVEWLNGFIAENISIDVMNTLGQNFFSSQQKISSANGVKQIDLKDVASGIYFIEIKSENSSLRKKIVIE